MRSSLRITGVIAVAGTCLLAGAAARAVVPPTVRVSVSSGGAQARTLVTVAPAGVSEAGRDVLMSSKSARLVAGDTNGRYDVFLHDTVAGTTVRVSVSSTGREANGASIAEAMSPDARFVLFSSGASNLSVAADTNRATDVFLRDRVLGTTRRVSIPPAGGQFGVPSHGVAVSADGRYVLFTARPAGARTRTYLRDRLLGTTTRIGREWSRFDVIGYALSGNGRTVAYVRRGEKNGFSDLLFVRDRVARTTTELNEQPGWTFDPSVWSVQLSADGRTALVSGQSTTGAGDGAVSVWRAGGSLTQVTDGTYWAKGVGLSGDGTRVAFVSEDRHLVPGDTNGARDVFVRDLTTGVTTRVDLSASGAQLPHGVEVEHWPPVAAVGAMSGDGRFVAFDSVDAGVPADTNGTVDVYLSGPLS